MRARCRLSWRYLEPVLGVSDVNAGAHSTTLHASIFRFDDDMLVNHHVYGLPASQSPVLHFHRVAGGRCFQTYLDAFERVWATATAVTAASTA